MVFSFYAYLFEISFDFLEIHFVSSLRLNCLVSIFGKAGGLNELVSNFMLMARYEDVIFLVSLEAFSETNKYQRLLPLSISLFKQSVNALHWISSYMQRQINHTSTMWMWSKNTQGFMYNLRISPVVFHKSCFKKSYETSYSIIMLL